MKKTFLILILIVFANCMIHAQGAADTIKYAGAITCITGSVVLAPNNPASGATFQWQLNGTAIAGATSETYTATQTGEYRVLVNGSSFRQVNVSFKAVASFTSSVVSECVNGAVNFTNTTTPASNANGYEWNFGDPNSGANSTTSINASHTFVGNGSNASQNFTVRLIATSQSCKDTAYKSLTIKQSPNADLGPNPDNNVFKLCSSQGSGTLTFNNLSTTKATNTNYKIVWGDNTPDYVNASFIGTVSHAYNAGNYNLTFSVTGSNGCVTDNVYNIFIGSNPAVGIGNPGNTSICSGDSLTFPITGTATNTIGTRYIVSFNDASKADTFYHPNVPSSIAHIFKITSCGITSGGSSNSFQASISATNPCSASFGSVVPIYVSGRPKASFTNVRDTICVNSTTTFSNNSLTTSYINNGSCVPGKFVWSITPAAGWSIVSGTLGSENGIVDPVFWQSGSTAINIRFTTAGTYFVKVNTGNSSCGSDSIIKTICVNPLPVAGFTVNQIMGCSPLTMQATNTSNQPICGSNTYTWAVTYAATGSCLPATSSFTYLNGTNASSTDPQFRFDNPGTYTISLITKNSSGLCTSNTFTQQIIVKAKPTVTLTTATTVCQNGTITPSITVGNCNATTPATYLWTFAGGTPATATSLSPGSISYATAGTYTIQVDVTNECGTTTKTQQITVGAAPDVIVPANQTFCNGVATGILVFSSSVNGTTYSWTNNNTTIGLSASGNGNVPSFIAKNTTGVPVTATITVTPLNGCTGQSKSFTITINPGATIANAGINQKLCNATTATLAANTAVVGNGSWAKIAGNSGVIDNAALPTSTFSGLTAPDSIVLVWTIANAANTCKGTSDTVVILNRPAITVANAGNDTTVCGFPSSTSSTAIVLNGNIPKYFETGIWTVVTQPNNGNSSIPQPNNPKAVFSFFNIGTYVLKWTITNDAGCVSSATFTHKVFGKTVSGSIGATSSSSNNVCIGSNSTLTLTSYTGTILKWQYNTKPIADNIWSDTLVTTPTIQFTNVQDTFAVRAIVVSADTACASSDTTASVIVNVAPQPIGGITGPDATVCGTSNNGVVTLSGQVGTIARWEKSIDNGTNWSTITNTTASLAYSNITQTTKFRAIVQNGVCVAVASTTTTISVAGATGSSNAGADQFLCNQTGTQLNAAVAPSGSTGSWVQVAGPAVNITDATHYNTTITGLTPNTYKFFWAISNGVCAATNDTVVVINYPALTNTIIGTTQTICGGQSVTLVGQNATGGSGLYTYQWQQSTDSITWVNIAGTTLANINFSPLNTVFVRRLVTSNTCNLASNAATIIVQPSIGNNGILKDTTICIGNPLAILTGSLPTGGNTIYTYQWENSTDGGITWLPITLATAKDYLPVGLTVTTKFRRVVSSNVCTGLQANSSNVVTITINPNAKAQYNYTKNIDCAVFNITNAITNVTNTGNGSYIWYANNVQIGNSATVPNYSIINPQDSVVVKLKAISLYGCKNDSLEHKFYTITKPAPSFTLSDTVGCGPLAITITNTTVNAHLFNFKWDFGNGSTSSLTNPSTVILQSNPTRFDTIYTITLSTFTTCDTVVTVQKIRVKSKPQALFTPNKTIGCSPLPVTFNNTSRGNNTNFFWDFGDGSATVVTSNTNAVQHTFSTGKQDTFKVKLIASNTCGNDTLVYNIVVSPNKIKLDFAVNGSDAVSCLPSTVRFINNTSGATSFNWNFGDGNVLSTTKNLDTVSHTFLQAGNYTVMLFATNGCSDTTTSELIQVFNAPSANFNAIPTTVCLGDTIRFTNQSDTITSLLWNFKDGYTSTVINPTHAYKVAGIYNVQLTAIRQYNSGLACTDTISKPIMVLSTLPGAMKVSDSISSCVPFATTFTNLSLPSAITIWQYGNGVADTGNVVTYTYTKVGNYTVNMLATNSGGCKFAATANIQVNGPDGIWQHDKGFVCGATPVRYEVFATSTDSVRWDFGDGISITTSGKIIYHSYTKSGLYLPTATLISSNLKTCIVTLKAIDTIKVDYVSAGFRISDNKICGITTVTFTDTSRSYFPIASYSWGFGNGNTAITPIATQQYTTTNTWQTDLTITSTSGCSSTIRKNSFINVNNYPKVTIQTLPVACINKPINYFANVTSNDSINLYSWQFSNGANLNGQSVNNLYNTVGTYTAKVLVRTIYGCADSTTLTHTLNPTPTVVASVDQLICRGKSIPLSVTGAATYSWIPLNSNLSCYTCTNPIAAPITTTNYIVTGYNSVGCSDDDTVLITVAQLIKLTVNPNDTICIGQSLQLSVAGGTSYVWSPSIGLSNTTSATPLATPTLTTKYQVIGFDNHNCFQDTAYVVVAVGQYPTIQLAADQVLATGTLLPLNYTSTNGPLTSWKWTPSTNLSCSDCAVPIATIKKDICYTVVAANMYQCAATDTICIKVFCENTQVFIPNVFTPDNDGVNDVLMVRGTGIKAVKSFRIFNRWGQIVFERGNIIPNNASQGWDGKINGTPASPDVYVYTCEVVCENDVTFTYKGNVAIIK